MPSTRDTLLHMISILSMSFYLGGCSITETVHDILSSTTPGDWYSRDGLPKAEHKVDVFVAINMDNLKVDLARGQGEYLEALSVLLAVAPDRRQEFSMLAQKEYTLLAGQDRNAVGQSLIALSQPLRAP
jgi:DUF3015 family protein